MQIQLEAAAGEVLDCRKGLSTVGRTPRTRKEMQLGEVVTTSHAQKNQKALEQSLDLTTD